MKVLIVADLVVRSGVGGYIQQLSKELTKEGHTVFVASPRKEIELFNGVEYIPLKSSSLKNTFKNARAIRRICKEKQIDVIHAQHRNTTLYLRFAPVPVVVSYHTSQYPKNRLKDLVCFWGDACICTSSEVRELLREKKVKESKLRLVLNGVDNGLLTPLTAEEKSAKKARLGYANKTVFAVHGRIDEVKGLDLLVEAAVRLTNEELQKVKFLVSGEKKGEYYERLLQAIEEKGLQPYFDFLGWTESREIFGVGDMTLAPSRREGFPLSVIESMFMGVPVCRTKTGGYADMEGYVVPLEQESPESIAKEMRKFLENPQSYEALAKAASEFAENNCTIARMTKSTLVVYESVLQRGKKG